MNPNSKSPKSNTSSIGIISYNVPDGYSTNPMSATRTRTTANRLYSGYTKNSQQRQNVFNYQEILKNLNATFRNFDNFDNLGKSLSRILASSLQTVSLGIGFISKRQDYINVKFVDKINAFYSAKIMMNDNFNPIVKCVKEKSVQYVENAKFLNLSYLENSQITIVPVEFGKEVLGVFIVGDNAPGMHTDLYQSLANYIGLHNQYQILSSMVAENADIDPLTGLKNHKSFQEELHKLIDKSDSTKDNISVCIFDVENITQINREFGHAVGDEIIKSISTKIKESMRNTDFAARYGGDEVAIIMPSTSLSEAKYLAEFITYSISCVYFDNIGPIKVSAGVADWPNSTKDQEKLLVLAEQAMCLSKSKTCETGQSSIVTVGDYNFWDDQALKSFAEILLRRHAQIGIDFEDELVQKFHSEEIISNKHLLEVVTSLASTIDAKDTYTKGHSTCVSKYAEALAKEINLPQHEVERIKLGAMLHDIGKIGIPESVLRKPTMLNDEEWKIMKQHPEIGAEKVLMPNESLHDLIPMVKFHHEHMDGSGYPYGLKGEDIPLSARIVAVADTYHALISDRPYRKGMSCEKACEILKLGAGIQWDKELVRHFIRIAPSLMDL